MSIKMKLTTLGCINDQALTVKSYFSFAPFYDCVQAGD